MKVLFSVALKHIYETPVNGAFVRGLNWLYFRQELDPSLEEFGFLFGKENEVTGCSYVLFSNKEDHEIAYYYLHISNPKCNNDCLEKEDLVCSVVKKRTRTESANHVHMMNMIFLLKWTPSL